MSESLNSSVAHEDIFSHETSDDPDIISFEDYRKLCDETDGFRKIGIQDLESYESILEDERTVFIDHENQRIPLIASLEHEKMYDDDRVLLLSGKKNAMLLAVPVSRLGEMGSNVLHEIDEDTIIMIEEFVPTDESTNLEEHDVSRLPFADAEPFNFINPDLSDFPQNETAWMAAYRFEALPVDGPTRLYEGDPAAGDFIAAWNRLCIKRNLPALPGENPAGTFVLSAEQLAQRPDIIEQLWEISQIGFGKILGAHHPISMEFNKQFFDKQIAADNTVTSVHYVDGKIECFGFLGLDLKNNEWQNEESTAIQNELSKAKAEQRILLHFYELIGRGQRGMAYAKHVLNTLFDTTAEMGYPVTVFFESTNLSSLYIPPLIVREMNKSETISMTSDIDILGKLSYWGLVAKEGAENDLDTDSPLAA